MAFQLGWVDFATIVLTLARVIFVRYKGGGLRTFSAHKSRKPRKTKTENGKKKRKPRNSSSELILVLILGDTGWLCEPTNRYPPGAGGLKSF